jgi:hypothetical protein
VQDEGDRDVARLVLLVEQEVRMQMHVAVFLDVEARRFLDVLQVVGVGQFEVENVFDPAPFLSGGREHVDPDRRGGGQVFLAVDLDLPQAAVLQFEGIDHRGLARGLAGRRRAQQVAGACGGVFVGLLVERFLQGFRHFVEYVLALLLVQQFPDLDAVVGWQGIEDACYGFGGQRFQSGAKGSPVLAAYQVFHFAQGLLFLGALACLGIVFDKWVQELGHGRRIVFAYGTSAPPMRPRISCVRPFM